MSSKTQIKQLNEMRSIAGLPPLSKKQEQIILEAREPAYDARTRTGYNELTDMLGVFLSSHEEGYVYFIKNKKASDDIGDIIRTMSNSPTVLKTQYDVGKAVAQAATQGGDIHEISLSELDGYLADYKEYYTRHRVDNPEYSEELSEYTQSFDLAASQLKRFIKRIGSCKIYSLYFDYCNAIVVVRDVHPQSAVGPKPTMK